MNKAKYLFIFLLSLFFISCGTENSSKASEGVVEEKRVLNDNTNKAFSIPNVKNSEELPTNKLQTLK